MNDAALNWTWMTFESFEYIQLSAGYAGLPQESGCEDREEQHSTSVSARGGGLHFGAPQVKRGARL